MNARLLRDIHDGFAAAAVYHAAERLGLLDRTASAPASITELAHDCGTSEHGTGLLVAALHALGVLERLPGDRYRPAGPSATPIAALIRTWERLEESVRSGRPALRADTVIGASTLYPQLVSLLGTIFGPVVLRAAELLPGYNTILDLGAGAAPWSIALAQRNPNSRVTALDLPSVLPATQRAVDDAGCAEQFRLVGADMFTVELPREAYDLIIMANVCHLFSPDANQRLIERLTPSLRRTGTIALIDIVPADTPQATLYELGLFLRSSEGRTYDAADYTQWISHAGLLAVDIHMLSDDPPIALLTGARRAAAGAD